MGVLDSEIKEILEDADKAEEVSKAEIQEIFRKFSDEKLARLCRRVYLFVLRNYEQDTWLAEELTQEAFLRVFKGKRCWRPRKATLFECLCGAARSISSNTPKCPVQSLEEIFERPRLKKSDLALLKEEDYYLYQQLCDKLRDLVRGDSVLSRMTEFYIQCPDSKPRDMRSLMPDIPKKRVERKFQRLTGLIGRLKKEMEDD